MYNTELKIHQIEIEVDPKNSLKISPHIKELILIDGENLVHIKRVDKA